MSRITCNKCRKRRKCKEPCSKIENYLQRKDKLKDTYSQRYMRKKETPYLLSDMELFLFKRSNIKINNPHKHFDDNLPYLPF